MKRLLGVLRYVKKIILISCVIYTIIDLGFEISPENSDIAKNQCVFTDLSPAFVFVWADGEPSIQNERVFLFQDRMKTDEQGRLIYEFVGGVGTTKDYGNSAIGINIFGKFVSFSREIIRLLGYLGEPATAHNGDWESFTATFYENEWGYYEVRLLVHQHGKTSSYVTSVKCTQLSQDQMAIVLYISKGKHAIYPSLRYCNNQTIERCSKGEIWIPEISDKYNVGSKDNPNNPFETVPELAEIFTGEDAWSDCFWGGYDHDENSVCRATYKWIF